MIGFDWKQLYGSVKAAEKDLTGFTFKGEGWYETANDTLLVRTFKTAGTKFARGRKPSGPGLDITVWNRPDGRQHVIEEFATAMKLDVHIKRSVVKKAS